MDSKTNSYADRIDAEIAAKHLAKLNGYAFAVEWFDHWSVEPRKPSFRGTTSTGRNTLVIEVRSDGSQVFA